MKEYIKHIKRITITVIFLMFLLSNINKIDAYQIRNIVVPKEDFGTAVTLRDDFPTFVYKKQTAAYPSEVTNYNNATKDSEGWVYTGVDVNNSNVNQDNSVHNTAGSFNRIYEYLHKYQNSIYSTEANGNSVKRQYSYGTLWPQTYVIGVSMYTGYVYDITGETENYKGFYWIPATRTERSGIMNFDIIKSSNDLVLLNNNKYRWAIKNNIYISDNYINKQTANEIWEKFGTNSNEKELIVYNSAVTRTKYTNDKYASGDSSSTYNEAFTYFKNMDTAFKFWETTIRGNNSNWYWSSSTTGQPTESSIINYYDNEFVIPKGNPKKIYVRHIDVTGVDDLNSNNINNSMLISDVNNGQVIEVEKNMSNNKYVFSSYKWPNSRNVVYGDELFNETYEMNLDDMNWIVGNIKYQNEEDYLYNGATTTVSYLNPEGYNTESEANILANYNCVGFRVGTGDSVENAIANKDSNIIRTDGGDWSLYRIDGNSANDYIVVEFYYKKKPTDEEIPPPRESNERQVFVRHIDVTGLEYNEITPENIDKLISEGQFLDGTGKALKIGTSSYELKQTLKKQGYQEWFKIPSGYQLQISKDDSTDYNCIGSNMTKSSIDIYDAKEKMDDKLDNNSGKYSTTTNNKSYRNTTGSDYIILVDFYYTSKHSGTAIDRPTKGRLGLYKYNDTNLALLSGEDSTDKSINNYTSDDSDTVYDVVPSDESLIMTMSIDNAYVYMLGGINIKEQKIQDTYEFDYTITQEYTVRYLDWSSSCSGKCNGTDDDKYETSDCKNKYSVQETYTYSCPDGSGGTTTCTGKKTVWYECAGSWTADADTITTSGTISRTYKYQIPYEYTFYKVKNMRIYTISKIELIDGYNNKGLPLFDGKTHTAYTTGTYKSSFNESNSDFIESTSKQFASNTNTTASNGTNNVSSISKTLDTKLVFYYDNDDGDVRSSDAKEPAIDTISKFFDDNITHTLAAKITDFDVTSSSSAINDDTGKSETTDYSYNKIKETSTQNHLHMTFYVKNDEVGFEDQVSGDYIKIVGNGTNVLTQTPYTSGWNNKENETSAVKFVDLVEYTKNKSRSGSVKNGYTYNVNAEEETIKISTVYPKSIRGTTENAIGSQYLPSNYLTDRTYFTKDSLQIPSTRLNGKYYSYGKIYYNLLSTSNRDLNFDADDDGVVTCNDSNKSECHDWNDLSGSNKRIAVTGSGTSSFVDTEMYNTSGSANPEKTTLIAPGTLRQVVMEYGRNSNGNSNKADVVHVFTPISFTTWTVTGQAENNNKQVNHTTENTNNQTTQIQKNSRFTIAMEPTASNTEYSGLSTDGYLMQYYIRFDNLDVQNIIIYDAKNSSGRNYDIATVTAGEWIGPIYNQWGTTNLSGSARVSAFALADPNNATENSVVNQETNSYTVRAVAYNAPSGLLYDLVRNKTFSLLDNTYNIFRAKAGQSHQKYYDQKNIEDHNNYVAEKTVSTQNLSRVYDFKVTDLKDIDWKNIFRNSTTTTTNIHTSKAYYSGVKKWNVYTTQSNQLLTRDASEIGSTKKQILPLGPYKNTNTTYVKAPKLGYKFSFDLKTTGASANKKIVITPSFYYISKDPNPVNVSKPIIEKDIELYYKNSNNKYVTIDNYNLYFVPDDGYRLTFEGTDAAYRFSNSSLSKSTVKLGTTTELTLTSKMMEEADNMFVQIWYGEYKLPNSTIAIKKNGNINSDEDRLTDGYIGVKFDIKVYEYDSSGNTKRVLSYNIKDQNSSNTNTTQWDYEGYLGYDKNGANITSNDNIRLALEGMSWKLTQEDYEFVRGTVILYDTDAKASSDYE